MHLPGPDQLQTYKILLFVGKFLSQKNQKYIVEKFPHVRFLFI